jgi:hypothetical protein
MTRPDDIPASEKHKLLATRDITDWSGLLHCTAILTRVPEPGKLEPDAAFSAGEVHTVSKKRILSARKLQVFLSQRGQLCKYS